MKFISVRIFASSCKFELSPVDILIYFSVFGSLDMSRSNSMTSSGQCRLAPLIQCIQDSSQLYDYCVRILFKLYSQLPADVLSGHRARFLKQFHQLRQFYNFSSSLQYFKNLIQIPLLPEVSSSVHSDNSNFGKIIHSKTNDVILMIHK